MKRIVAMFLILFTVLILVFSVFIIGANKNLHEIKSTYLSEISKNNVTLVETKIKGMLDLIKAESVFISNISENKNQINIDATMQILKQESSRNEFKRMGFMLIDGTTYFSDSDKTFNLLHENHFKLAMEGTNNISEPIVDVADGTIINVFVSPIYKNSEIIGAVFGTLETSKIRNLLEASNFNGQGYSYIITTDGANVVNPIHPNSIREFDNFYDAIEKLSIEKFDIEKFKSDIKMHKNGNLNYVLNAQKRNISYRKIGANDWYMISVVPTDAIMHNYDLLIKQLLILTIAIILSVMFISIYAMNFYMKNSNKLEKLAYYDEVTEYNNFKKFKIIAKKLLDNEGEKYALIYFDIKKFKIINDVFGFEKGNETLRHICSVLDSNHRKGETFARVTADRFVYFYKYNEKEDIINFINLLNINISSYIENYTMTLSFGIRIIDNGDKNINTYYDNAMIASLSSKNEKVNINYVFYDDSLRILMLQEKEYENAMYKGLEKNEFIAYLQPKYSLETGRIIGAEALVRWNYKFRGIIYPSEFIPLFEKNGFIKKIDLFMFEQVCKFLKSYKETNIEPIVISTNFSRFNSINIGTSQELHEISKKYDIDPSLIEIEITESAITDNIENLIAITKEIKSQGFGLSIDDFGSGYSSLNCLKDIPADIIKLDKKFLFELSENERGCKIIKSLIEMAKALSLVTIAEGVETIEHVKFLKSVGCDIAQGFFYARPMPVEDFTKLLIEQNKKKQKN